MNGFLIPSVSGLSGRKGSEPTLDLPDQAGLV